MWQLHHYLPELPNLLRAFLTAVFSADPAPVIHYAPAENLEHVDVALIDRAEHEIDLAAYVLTDWSINPSAHTRRRSRHERERAKVFQDLAETPTVEIRTRSWRADAS